LKNYFIAVALLVATILAPASRAQDLKTKVQKATVIVYMGKQVCEWKEVESSFFGFPFKDWEWTCEFRSAPICTATNIDVDKDEYTALTAGHCFDPTGETIDKVYIGDDVNDKPVLRKATVVKYDFTGLDGRYDYAIVKYKSSRIREILPVDTDSETVSPGMKVISVNFGLMVAKMTVEGEIVSGILPETKDRFLATIGFGPGASGSALVDKETGKIIGIAESIFPGTQMPSVFIRTGNHYRDFTEDDSAGIRPEKPKGVPPVRIPETPKPPTTQDMILELFKRMFAWIMEDIRRSN
jgi:hypothetical protein